MRFLVGHLCLPKRGAIDTLDQPLSIKLSTPLGMSRTPQTSLLSSIYICPVGKDLHDESGRAQYRERTGAGGPTPAGYLQSTELTRNYLEYKHPHPPGAMQ